MVIPTAFVIDQAHRALAVGAARTLVGGGGGNSGDDLLGDTAEDGAREVLQVPLDPVQITCQ
ncbi:MAG: hypothetical protein M1401_14410 [Chloroflexi bacterium]|nr:hypothetical protein [Chloroflexota bacterium]MCL5110021.1 hypothetical protein [Chloroflexota bacterium]